MTFRGQEKGALRRRGGGARPRTRSQGHRGVRGGAHEEHPPAGPLPHAEIELELLALANRIFDAITEEPMPTDRVAEVGARLIELHCVGKASLQCTIDVVAAGLLAEPELRRLDRLPERVAHLIGAL